MTTPTPKQPKLSLLSLPPELLLQIASHHLDDFTFWQSNQCRSLSKYLPRRQLSHWPYLALAKAHPYLYALLITRRLDRLPEDERVDFGSCGMWD